MPSVKGRWRKSDAVGLSSKGTGKFVGLLRYSMWAYATVLKDGVTLAVPINALSDIYCTSLKSGGKCQKWYGN